MHHSPAELCLRKDTRLDHRHDGPTCSIRNSFPTSGLGELAVPITNAPMHTGYTTNSVGRCDDKPVLLAQDQQSLRCAYCTAMAGAQPPPCLG
jgi:hypothetical protein